MVLANDQVFAAAIPKLSDAELVRETLPLDRNLGCYAWLAALTLPWPVGFLFGVGWGFLTLLFGIAVCRLLSRLDEQRASIVRARLAEREFALRFGHEALEYAASEARTALAQDPALEAVVLLHGHGLPHGRMHFVRTHIGPRASLYTSRAPSLADLWRAASTNEALTFRGELPLSLQALATLRGEVEALAARAHDVPDHFVYDGFPCHLMVLRQGAEPLDLQLNLMGVPDEGEEHPAYRLATNLVELAAPPRRRSRSKVTAAEV